MIYVIYVGERVTSYVQGSAWRSEKCEHCGRQFHYRVSFTGTGQGVNPYFLDSHGSRQRADEKARYNLDDALRHEVYPVPCAHCALYQGYMVPTLRTYQFLRLWRVGRRLAVLSPLFLILGCIINVEMEERFSQAGRLAVALGPFTLCLTIGILLLRIRRRWKGTYDPNAEEHAESRWAMAAELSLKTEDFERLRIPASELPLAQRGQLVGKNCVLCGERISYEPDGRYCQSCGSPLHNRCAAPSASDGCRMCGARAQAG